MCAAVMWWGKVKLFTRAHANVEIAVLFAANEGQAITKELEENMVIVLRFLS